MAIIVEPYAVSITKRWKQNDKYLPLDNFADGSDFCGLLNSWLSPLQTSPRAFPERFKAAKITSYRNQSRFLRGRLQVGNYGFSSPIVNVETGMRSYEKQKIDADLIPYYFAFYIPSDCNYGVALLQKMGVFGIKSIIDDLIKTEFKDLYDDLTLNIRPLAPADAAKNALQHDIHEVRFVQHAIPADIAGKFTNKQHPQGKITISVETSEDPMAKLNSLLGKIINGESEIPDLLEFDEFTPDSLKAVIQMGDRQRIMEISERVKFRPSFDITEEVDAGNDGYAKFSSIDEVCDGIADDLSEVLNS